VVSTGGGRRVAAAGTDAEDTDAPRVDAGDGGERVDRVGDVLTATVRILEVAELSAALPLVGGVEREGP
jgi:hypothetical protein